MAIDPCSKKSIQQIDVTECISKSLSKINNNFLNLESVVCDLKNKIDKTQNIRTFFYYGPNAETNATSNMEPYRASRPSDLTIRTFVNSETQLNLPAISSRGDVAYVVYQKTGFLNNLLVGIGTDYQQEQFNTIVTPLDTFNSFAPIFIVWRLTYNNIDYDVDVGFPRFVQAQTDGTSIFWNQPQTWSQY